LLGHPVVGTSFEGFAIENIAAACASEATCHFYRTSGGAEIDLVLAWPDSSLWAIEVKRSLAPKVERGFHAACEDLAPARRFVVYPGQRRWPVAKGVEVIGLADLCAKVARVARPRAR
jgi:predicted AAA+ superfamily ATPase